MHSVAIPRVTGSRSSIQNCKEAIAAFQMEYSHASNLRLHGSSGETSVKV